MPRLPKTELEKRNKPSDSSLTAAERQHLEDCALAANVRFTDFVRDIVLTATVKISPGRLRSSPGRQGKRLTVWLTLAEREELRERATELGVTVSDYIHHALLDHTGFEPDTGVLRLSMPTKDAKRLSRRAAANKQSLPDYLVKQSLGGQGTQTAKRPTSDLVMQLDNLIREMNAIGVNINQLAHQANAGKHSPSIWAYAAKELQAQTSKADEILQQVAADYVR